MDGARLRRWAWGGGWVPCAGAAVVAMGLVLRATARYGPGAEPDSVTYLAAAGHLRAGQGFADIDGSPLTLFPPVFPAAVAALEAVGLSPLPAARFLNVAMFGLLVLLGAVWARRLSGSAGVGVAVAAIVAVAPPMVGMASTAMSEPVGLVLIVLTLMLLTEALRTGARRTAAVAGVVAALACLTRYASVVLLPLGAVVLAARPGAWRNRLRAGAVFLATGLVPVGAWLLRNVAVDGTATGDGRGTSSLGFAGALRRTLAGVGAWVLPAHAPPALKLVLGIAVPGAVVIGARQGLRGPRRLAILPVVGFIVAGIGGVVWFEGTMAIDPPGRFLLPVFVPLVVGGVVAVAGVARGRGWRPAASGVLVAAVIGASVPGLAAFLGQADRRGLLDYSTPGWARSPLLAWLKDHPVHGAIASDDPYILDLRLGIPADLTPARTYYASTEPTDELSGFVRRATRAATAGGLSVVWFPRSYQGYLYGLADLERAVCLREEAHFADGDVLRSCL